MPVCSSLIQILETKKKNCSLGALKTQWEKLPMGHEERELDKIGILFNKFHYRPCQRILHVVLSIWRYAILDRTHEV